MAEQYWIGEFFVDLSRNQITQNKQPQTLAPKALAVLTCLAENQGNVVSQDTLLETVWPDTVVSNNTLQRCIAQLRKALGDDGKVQVYIKTHAKKGYSLECNVVWQTAESQPEEQLQTRPQITITEPAQQHPISPSETETNALKTPSDNTQKKEASTYKQEFQNAQKISIKSLLIVCLIMVILAAYTYTLFKQQKAPLLTIESLRAVTATDNRELASIYSQNGEYIIFHRYADNGCASNIWAKNTTTQEEVKLTEQLDAYGKHSFSKDGKELVFIRTLNCEQPVTQRKCYQLMSLDFEQALLSPQPMRILLECNFSEIRFPNWMNNNQIALLQKQQRRWQLISYSARDNKSKVLHQVDKGNIIAYDYSTRQDRLAVISIHPDNHLYIEALDAKGTLLSSNRIELPTEIENHRYIYPKFSAIDDLLLFSSGRQLFTLTYQGEVTKVNLPLDQAMGAPNFNETGDRALAIKGVFDTDVMAINRADFSLEVNKEKAKESYQILERSTEMDGDAQFQPNGQLVAYESKRSGEQQIWLFDGQRSKQLSRFNMDTYINGFNWSKDGRSLLVNARDQLTQINLDGEVTAYSLSYRIIQLLQWQSDKKSALALILLDGLATLADVNLETSTFEVLTNKPVRWAQKSENGVLIYSDNLDQFWLRDSIEDKRIAILDSQGGEEKRFLLKGDTLYGVNDANTLWAYHLANKHFELLTQLPSNIDEINDINELQLLLSAVASSRKEVIELTFSR